MNISLNHNFYTCNLSYANILKDGQKFVGIKKLNDKKTLITDET